MTAVKVFCSQCAGGAIPSRHFSPQLIAAVPVYRPDRAMPRWRNAQYGKRPELKSMKAKILVESAQKLLVERCELITNCLAVLALLVVGVVWA